MEANLIELVQKCPDINLTIKASDLLDFGRTLKLELIEAVKSAQKPINTQPEELLTREEVMKELGVSAPTLWRWKKAGYLVPVQIGSMDRYRRSDLNKVTSRKGGTL